MKPKVRVLHVITRLVAGGADENTLATVDGLDKSCYEVDLLIGGQSDFAFASQSQCRRLITLPALIREPHPIQDLVALGKLLKIIRQGRYHIVHTHTAKAGILGRLAGFMCNTPLVIHTLHGSTFHGSLHPLRSRLYLGLERMAARATTQFVTVGEDLREIYLHARVGRADRYVTIRSGFELERFRLSAAEVQKRGKRLRESLNISVDQTVVGTAGRLEARKGHAYFLQTAKQVLQHQPQTMFLIAGEGPAERELLQQARRLGIEKKVVFLGHRYDIEDVMAGMDVFVLTSLWEGLPRVLVQAAALGKPIVSFDSEGVREVVRDGQNGYVLPLRDVHGLAEKIALLAADRPQAQRMGEASRSMVTAEWDVDHMVDRISDLYQQLLRCKGIELDSISENRNIV